MEDTFGNQKEMEVVEDKMSKKDVKMSEPPAEDEDVINLKVEFMSSEIGELMKKLLDAKHTRVVEAEAKLSFEKNRQTAIEKVLISKLQQSGQTASKIKGLASISLNPKIHFSALKEKEDDKMKWFKEDPEYKHCVKETVHPQTFKKVMEEVYKRDGKVPEFVSYYPETKLSTRRA